MKILVTGSTGFVGQNLLASLQDKELLELIPVSLRGGIPSEISPAEVYIHLAGKAHDLKNTSEESEYYKVNFELTQRLFDIFLADKEAKTFIFISSVKAVRDQLKGSLTEDMVCEPQKAYGKSKQMAEEYILSRLPDDKFVYILRPCMIHGPGNKGNLNLLYSLVSKGFPWPLGAFENQRSFCSIDNLVFVLEELLSRSDVPTGVYNIADDNSFSTNELIGLIAESQGKRPRVLKIPQNTIKGLAKIGDVIKLPLNTERLEKLTESYLVSNDKLKKAIGKPLPINAKDGLLKTFKSFESK